MCRWFAIMIASIFIRGFCLQYTSFMCPREIETNKAKIKTVSVVTGLLPLLAFEEVSIQEYDGVSVQESRNKLLRTLRALIEIVEIIFFALNLRRAFSSKYIIFKGTNEKMGKEGGGGGRWRGKGLLALYNPPWLLVCIYYIF